MYIVKPEKLKHVTNKIILDCRFDMMSPQKGETLYKENHIEGAHYINLDKDLVGTLSQHGGRHPLCDLDEFKVKLETIGINNEIDVFIYDDGQMPMAARLWFTMQLLGKDAYVIEGGYDALVAAGFNVTTKLPPNRPDKLTTMPRLNLIATLDDVLDAKNHDNTVVVDSRSSDRYLGLGEPFDKFAGHIPEAINVFWQDAFEDNHLKDIDSLKENFNPLDAYESVIFHCGSGITGAVNMLTYAELGKKSKLYVGSYSDYVSHKGLPLIIKNNETIILE